ncbi:MAG: DUF1570 domain-containing protein [Planctomycetota bacterium]
MPTKPRARESRRPLAFAVAMLALLTQGPLPAQTTEARDTVWLTNGKELKGRVVRVDSKEVVLRTGSRDRTFPRDEVERIVSVASQHRELIAAWQDTASNDADALLALAMRAEHADLPHEARLLRWYAVLQRPTDAKIHEALGNRPRGGGFLVEIDRKWVPFDKADALGEDFDDAWRLRSEHFALQCAAGLRAGLDTLMELETLYWLFMDVFGQDLALLEIVEAMPVRLYRSRAQMPNLSNNVGAYFAADEQTLYTCFENGRPFALMHEATHALLFHFFVRAAKSRGSLPAWLDEGWAEYIDGRVQTRVPGKPKLLSGSVQAGHFAALATAKKQDDLYTVHRVLNFKTTDFQASSKQDVKYAQAWALFRYLFEHKDPALRALFLDYLREARDGQGQASTFRRLFARQEKQIETEPWQG